MFKKSFVGKKAAAHRRILSVLLAITVILSAFSLTSCNFSYRPEPISFEYTLTEQDEKDALAIIKELEGYVEKDKFLKIISTIRKLNDKQAYIDHQYMVSQIDYYSDLENAKAYETFVEAERISMNVRSESLRVLKKLYNTDSLAKVMVFGALSESQLNKLKNSGEEVTALEEEQNELFRQYLELEDPESEEWSAALAELYLKFVKNGTEYASHFDYDNYYEYAAKEMYFREYTKEQREAFRKNVKEQVLPFYLEIYELYKEKLKLLSDEQEDMLTSLRKDICEPTNEYLTEYIASYPQEMETVMNYLFEQEALIYSESENAHTVAFTNFSFKYSQPYIFLGKDCQNILTLVHELGHYTAFYHFADSVMPYDTCEVHSQGNEWLFLNDLEGKIDSDVYETFLLWRLRNGLEIVVVATLVDEYEEAVYTSDSLASAADLKGILSKVYNGYKGLEDAYPFEDIYVYCQYVTMESPVYYLSYATSELAAQSLYMIAEEDGYEKAQEIYFNLCLTTPTGLPFFDTLSDVGLPDPFKPDVVQRIIEAFEQIAETDSLRSAA